MSATQHDFHHKSEGIFGRTVTCTCGFTTTAHRKEADAADEWRAHAGLPPVRFDLHPMWCDEIHEQEPCDVHLGSLGLLLVTDSAHVVATLDDSGPDRGLVVTVTVATDLGDTCYRIPVDVTPKPGRRERKQHAFAVERTNGDHFVWTCRCGFVLVQDPGNTTVHADLLAHALSGAR